MRLLFDILFAIGAIVAYGATLCYFVTRLYYWFRRPRAPVPVPRETAVWLRCPRRDCHWRTFGLGPGPWRCYCGAVMHIVPFPQRKEP